MFSCLAAAGWLRCWRFDAMLFFIDKKLPNNYKNRFSTGPLTQVVEYLPFKQRVAGSSPARPTSCTRSIFVPIV